MMREQIYCMEQLSYGEKLGITSISGVVNYGFDDDSMFSGNLDDWSDFTRRHLNSPTFVFIRIVS